MDYDIREGHNQDMLIMCQDNDLQSRSLLDGESNMGNRLCKLENLMKTGKQEQHSLSILSNLSLRNHQNIIDSQL